MPSNRKVYRPEDLLQVHAVATFRNPSMVWTGFADRCADDLGTAQDEREEREEREDGGHAVLASYSYAGEDSYMCTPRLGMYVIVSVDVP
jgi:hypothetical protein